MKKLVKWLVRHPEVSVIFKVDEYRLIIRLDINDHGERKTVVDFEYVEDILNDDTNIYYTVTNMYKKYQAEKGV